MSTRGLESLWKAYPRQVYSLLDTKAAGLTGDQAQIRLAKYGKNVITKKKSTPTWLVFLSNFLSPMAVLLWISGFIAIIASFIGESTAESFGAIIDPQTLYLGIAIWLVTIVNGLFSFFQQFKANKATDALAKMLPSYARVIRDGQEARVAAEDLVPGDIMVLAEGDKIPADARIILCDDLTVTQSALDGEATPVRKTEMPLTNAPDSSVTVKNFVFSGTAVATGSARCAVIATGMQTEFGKIASLTQTIKPKKSPLEKEIERATKAIALIALSVGLAVLILGIVSNGLTHGPTEPGFDNPKLYLTQFIFALGMVVAFIPEGLSPTVTLSLAKAVQRMAKKGALIRSLNSVETLGSTTVICTDKTGTLTKNEMTVKSLYVAGQVLSVSGDGYAPVGDIRDQDGKKMTATANRDLKMLLTIGGLCSNAHLVPPKTTGGRYTVLGDPTEACLSVVAEKGLLSPGNQLNLTPRIRELPFDSVRKMMSTIHQLETPISGAQRICYTKGAPKEVLEKCAYLMEKGQKRAITQADIAAIMKQNDAYASDGLRVLAMAYRLLPKGGNVPIALSDYSPEKIENELVFVGLQAEQDPPRSQIKNAVKECHKAGIKVVMITGDYGLTALSIGRKIGIVKGPAPRVITGLELAQMDDTQLQEALQGEIIFARMAPEQKYRVVDTLQKQGEVVAVTGDGVNDAPALKKADIGVAMGIAGTDVAKEAADMVLTDDNFASIVEAIREGRAVFSNIRKFVTYIFNSNMPEAVPFLLPLLTFRRVPMLLTIMEVLFIDLGTDMVPALGLGAEPPVPDIMNQKPRRQDDHLINKRVLGKAFGWYGLMTSGLALIAFFAFAGFESQRLGIPYTLFSKDMELFDGNGMLVDPLTVKRIWESSTAVVLTSIVFCQIGMGLNCRTDKESLFKVGLFANRGINIGIIVEILLVIGVTHIPWVNEQIFQAYGINQWQSWLLILIMPAIVVGLEEGRKAILRSKDKAVVTRKGA